MLSVDAPIPLEAGEIADPARLAAYLLASIDGLEGPIGVFKFTAGNANLSYLVKAGERELVLKCEPPGAKAKSAHDMRREFRVISAVSGVYPLAPRALILCDDPEILGGAFFVMERVKGVIVRQASAAELGDAQARAQFLSLISALADLHALDVDQEPLAPLGRPQGYRLRQLEGWRKRMGDARTPDAQPAEDIEAWLSGHVPDEPQLAALVHNDFKLDNLVWDVDDPTRLIAVLDWEMATLGDPLMDLGVSLSFWVEEGDPQSFRDLRSMPSARPSVPGRAEAWRTYLARRGYRSDSFQFYLCFALYRRAVIEQQKYFRFRSGQTADRRFAELDVAVGALLDMSRLQMVALRHP